MTTNAHSGVPLLVGIIVAGAVLAIALIVTGAAGNARRGPSWLTYSTDGDDVTCRTCLRAAGR